MHRGPTAWSCGGILSHPAIIAREYGVPAVVATGNGMAVLRDGQQDVNRGGRSSAVTMFNDMSEDRVGE